MKDDLKYRFLKGLAETLDIARTMKDFPEAKSQDIRSLFLEFADTFKNRKSVNIYADGASRGNPGNAGAGIIITAEDGKVIKKTGKYLGKTTNNEAEYQALIIALEEAKAMGATDIKIFADSELMVRQIKGEYKVKSEGLRPLYGKAMSILMGFKRYDIIHIERDKNKEADRLANEAIDSANLLK